MNKWTDGYITPESYRWRGKLLLRRIQGCLNRFGKDPDLVRFYTNALRGYTKRLAAATAKGE